ncbi:MAG: hypothetical protein RLZZ215_3194 [Pseudomonadota bacterium]|jgi:glucose-6-phosphate 1-dehydrogenase
MPARDIYHSAVRHSLEKEGWIVTDDPYTLRAGGFLMYIDLGVERLIVAENGFEKIAVEVKCFNQNSDISEFHSALGQYINYSIALAEQEPDRVLYLAVPYNTYETFFSQRFIESVIKRNNVKLIVFKPDDEVIVKWRN